MNWTVTVQTQGQVMVPDMRLWIPVFDNYAGTSSNISGMTNAAGAFGVSHTFQCSPATNSINFAIVARLIRSDGYVGGGSSQSGARSCSTGPGGTTLGLGVAFSGTYDRDNAGVNCGGVGEPIRPSSNGLQPVYSRRSKIRTQRKQTSHMTYAAE